MAASLQTNPIKKALLLPSEGGGCGDFNGFIGTCRPSIINILPNGPKRRSNLIVSSSSSVVLDDQVSEKTSRINSLSQVSAVLGAQWGDEGKGKLVDILAKHFDIVARCQVINLKTQLSYLRNLKGVLVHKLGEEKANEVVSDAVYLISIGTNDYLRPHVTKYSSMFFNSSSLVV